MQLLKYTGCTEVQVCWGPRPQWYFLEIPVTTYVNFGPPILSFLLGFSLLINFFHKKKYHQKNKKLLIKKLLVFNIVSFALLAFIIYTLTAITY